MPASPLDHPFLRKPRDLLGGEAEEIAVHFYVVRPERAAVPLDLAWRLREIRDQPWHLHRPDAFYLGLEEHVAGVVLLVLHDVFCGVDRPDRDRRLLEAPH